MYISRSHLTDYLLSIESDVDVLLTSLFTIKSLIARYGRRVFMDVYIDSISDEYSLIKKLMLLFSSLSRHRSVKSITTLMESIKKRNGLYTKHFHIKSPKVLPTIDEKLLQSQGKADIQHETSESIGVYISGEGWHYKRSIDRDLQKIFS